MESKWNPAFLNHLKENIETVALLIEAIRKASILGMQGDQFSEVATADILEKLNALSKT